MWRARIASRDSSGSCRVETPLLELCQGSNLHVQRGVSPQKFIFGDATWDDCGDVSTGPAGVSHSRGTPRHGIILQALAGQARQLFQYYFRNAHLPGRTPGGAVVDRGIRQARGLLVRRVRVDWRGLQFFIHIAVVLPMCHRNFVSEKWEISPVRSPEDTAARYRWR